MDNVENSGVDQITSETNEIEDVGQEDEKKVEENRIDEEQIVHQPTENQQPQEPESVTPSFMKEEFGKRLEELIVNNVDQDSFFSHSGQFDILFSETPQTVEQRFNYGARIYNHIGNGEFDQAFLIAKRFSTISKASMGELVKMLLRCCFLNSLIDKTNTDLSLRILQELSGKNNFQMFYYLIFQSRSDLKEDLKKSIDLIYEFILSHENDFSGINEDNSKLLEVKLKGMEEKEEKKFTMVSNDDDVMMEKKLVKIEPTMGSHVMNNLKEGDSIFTVLPISSQYSSFLIICEQSIHFAPNEDFGKINQKANINLLKFERIAAAYITESKRFLVVVSNGSLVRVFRLSYKYPDENSKIHDVKVTFKQSSLLRSESYGTIKCAAPIPSHNDFICVGNGKGEIIVWRHNHYKENIGWFKTDCCAGVADFNIFLLEKGTETTKCQLTILCDDGTLEVYITELHFRTFTIFREVLTFTCRLSMDESGSRMRTRTNIQLVDSSVMYILVRPFLFRVNTARNTVTKVDTFFDEFKDYPVQVKLYNGVLYMIYTNHRFSKWIDESLDGKGDSQALTDSQTMSTQLPLKIKFRFGNTVGDFSGFTRIGMGFILVHTLKALIKIETEIKDIEKK